MDFVNKQPVKQNKPPRLVVYGPQGTGKTTFASKAPATIFMQIEDGLDGIEAYQEPISNYDDAIKMIHLLGQQDHKFNTLAIDSADWLERLVHQKVCADHRVNSINDIGYGRGFGYATDYWDNILKGLNWLRDAKDMTIILICHDQIKRFEDPMGASYDRYMLKLHQGVAALLQEWADGVLFMKTKVLTKSEDAGFNKKINKAIDGGVYMHTSETPAYQAKSRTSLSLPDEFPVSKENGWNDFINQIGKGAI